VDRKLRRAVLERLAAVEEMAVHNLPVTVARTQLKSITGGWRELLLEHQPDHKGRCPVCSGWLRRRRWPCQVWATAQQHLIGDGSALIWDERRPRQVEVVARQVEVIPRQVGTSAATDQTLAYQIRAGGEGTDQSQPTTNPRLPIHRAAVTGPQPALSRSQPAPRSPT